MSEEQVNEQAVPIENVEASTEAPIQAPAFADLISEDYQGLVQAKGFKSADDVLKSYTNLEKMVGNSVRLPSEDSSPEMRAEFLQKIAGIDGVLTLPEGDTEALDRLYTKLGRPEDKDGYDLGELGKVFGEETVGQFKELAHQLGLTDKQAKALAEYEASFIPSEEQIAEEHKTYMAKSEETLKKVWGQDYDNRVKASLDLLNQYEGKHPEAVAELKENVGNNPALRIILADLASSLQEGGTLDGVAQVGMSAEQASLRIEELKKDKGFSQSLFDWKHPDHAKNKARWTELHQLKQGG